MDAPEGQDGPYRGWNLVIPDPPKDPRSHVWLLVLLGVNWWLAWFMVAIAC